MKKLSIFIMLASQIIFSQIKSDDYFLQGNNFYKAGKYSEAIVAYDAVLDSKKHSSDLYFNIANCYYRLNKVAPAIFNYEKALLLNPDNIEAHNNLQIAQKLLVDNITVVNRVGFEKLLHDLTSSLHDNNWAWLAVYAGFLFLVCFLCYYFFNKTTIKRVFFVFMCLSLAGILLSLLSAYFEKSQSNNNNPAIVFVETTALKKEPKATSKEKILLHEGTKVYILGNKENYKKVQLTDETIGWINANDIKEIK